MLSPERSITAHLLAHHQVIARTDALRLGMSPGRIDGMVGRGQWRVARRGVYAVASSPVTPLQGLAVAEAAGGRGASLAVVSAAYLQDLVDECPEVPCIAVPSERHPHLPGIDVVRCVSLESSVRVVRGVRCTNLARTVIDCAAVLPPDGLTLLLDRAVIRHHLDVDALARRIAGHHRRPGVARLLAHLEGRSAGGAPPASVLERHLDARIAEAGLPEPVREHSVTFEGRVFRLDTAYPDLQLAFEVDGRAYHSSPEKTRRDHWRHAMLDRCGWTVRVFTWGEVVHDRVGTVAELRRSFDAATYRAERELASGQVGD